MSPRAACRLEALGFTGVHDFVPGKLDWLAHNLPVAGTAAEHPRIGRHLRHNVITAAPDEPIADIRARVATSPYDFALVLAADTTLLGRLRPSILRGADPTKAGGDVMEPGPSTLRPHEPTNPPTKSASGSRTTTSATRSSPTPKDTCFAPSTPRTRTEPRRRPAADPRAADPATPGPARRRGLPLPDAAFRHSPPPTHLNLAMGWRWSTRAPPRRQRATRAAQGGNTAAPRVKRLFVLSLNSPCMATYAQISGVRPR